MKQNKPDLLDTLIYCYGYIISLAIDMNLYETILYGDSPGTEQFINELYLCMQEQDLFKELMEEIK